MGMGIGRGMGMGVCDEVTKLLYLTSKLAFSAILIENKR